MSKSPRGADLLVVVGRPLNDNPFLAARAFEPGAEADHPGYSIIGESRQQALEAFQAGTTGPYTFWDTRNTGFVDGREVKTPEQVDWQL